MKDRNRRKSICWLISIFLLVSLTSCATGALTSTEQTVETDTAVSESTPTATVQAHTSTPAVPTALLISAEGANPNTVTQTQTTLESLAGTYGLTLEVYADISPEVVAPNVAFVVGVGSGLDFGGLASSFPETKFIIIGSPNAVTGENLSVIGDPTIEAQHQAFMAGYLAAVISSDYKVGGLFSADASAEDIDAFVIGAEFFCGLCKPQYPPYNDFPQTETVSPDSGINAFQSVVDTLVSSGIEVLYLQGALVSPESLTYLSDRGVKVISDSPPDMPRDNWVGTVSPDPASALPIVWEEVLAGSSGVQVPAPIALYDTDAGLVSEGRLRLFNDMAADLEAGLIATNIVP